MNAGGTGCLLCYRTYTEYRERKKLGADSGAEASPSSYVDLLSARFVPRSIILSACSPLRTASHALRIIERGITRAGREGLAR